MRRTGSPGDMVMERPPMDNGTPITPSSSFINKSNSTMKKCMTGLRVDHRESFDHTRDRIYLSNERS